MTHQPRRSPATSLSFLLPVLLVVGAGVSATWSLLGDDEAATPESVADSAREPVAVEAAGPRFATLDQLFAASDLVVRGSVVDIDEGRAITDPTDATAGIRTRLARIDVIEVLVGQIAGPLVVEQEAFLLDGTPLIVNGVPPLAPGDDGLMFLQVGDSDEFPYTAFVNEQGWVPLVDDRIAAIDPQDPVWSALAGQPADAVTRPTSD